MTEQQIPKLVASFVEHQSCFSDLSVEDGQWVIQKTSDAIALCVKAIRDRGKESPEVPESSLIHVDRTTPLVYPDWVTKALHPELENIGPAEFDVEQLECWLHSDQKKGVAKGEIICKYLETNDMLAGCLGLRDLQAIQKRGLAFVRKHFQGQAVFGWRSVVLDRSGNLRVPCLCGDGGGVVVDWRWLVDGWLSDNPALRFASKSSVLGV